MRGEFQRLCSIFAFALDCQRAGYIETELPTFAPVVTTLMKKAA